jgi:hypothetical protein
MARAVALDQANRAAACDGCSLTQPCDAGPPSRAMSLVPRIAKPQWKKDRVRHRRVAIFSRKINRAVRRGWKMLLGVPKPSRPVETGRV